MPRRFVGRAAELAALEAALAEAGEGRPAVVLVGGEAGVGKTRLVAELAGRAEAGGVLVATGGCIELTAGTAPYLAFTEALRDLAAPSGRAPGSACAPARRPSWRACCRAPRARPARARDSAARSRLLGQTHDLLAEAASTAPLLLVLEDVHWADRSTLDLAALSRPLGARRADHAGRHAPERRDARGGPALRAWLAELARADGVRRIELEPFSAAEIAELLACRALPGSHVAASIARRSGGNAFLAEELLDAGDDRTSRLDPRPARGPDRCAGAAGASRLARRRRGRPRRRRRAARRARRAARLRARRPRCGRPSRTTCSPSIRATAGSGFRHELVREAAYAELLPGERRRLHAACARVLGERPELGREPGVGGRGRGAPLGRRRRRGRARSPRACARRRPP